MGLTGRRVNDAAALFVPDQKRERAQPRADCAPSSPLARGQRKTAVTELYRHKENATAAFGFQRCERKNALS
jgi:hypothetical protein